MDVIQNFTEVTSPPDIEDSSTMPRITSLRNGVRLAPVLIAALILAGCTKASDDSENESSVQVAVAYFKAKTGSGTKEPGQITLPPEKLPEPEELAGAPLKSKNKLAYYIFHRRAYQRLLAEILTEMHPYKADFDKYNSMKENLDIVAPASLERLRDLKRQLKAERRKKRFFARGTYFYEEHESEIERLEQEMSSAARSVDKDPYIMASPDIVREHDFLRGSVRLSFYLKFLQQRLGPLKEKAQYYREQRDLSAQWVEKLEEEEEEEEELEELLGD